MKQHAANSPKPVWRPDFAALSPVFAPLVASCPRLATLEDWPTLADFNAEAERLGLATADGVALKFVKAEKRRRRRSRTPGDALGLPYEQRIHQLGQVSTRLASWHDLYNMLTWATFPKTKAALNLRQILAEKPSDEQRARGVSRSREQDRLAMFDEGGVIKVQCDGVADQFLVLGHALFESLTLGNADIRALTLTIDLPASSSLAAERLAEADGAAAALVAAGCFRDATGPWPDASLRAIVS